MQFPTLISKSKNEGEKIWNIKVKELKDSYEITTKYGLKGKKLRKSKKIIKSFKENKKKGITTLKKFVESQVEELYNKKLKEGYNKIKNEKEIKKYLESDTEKENENLNEKKENLKINVRKLKNINNKIENIKSKKHYPMLAYDYKKKSDKVIFPCFIQPKLDGVRALGIGNQLFSRNGNIFPTLEHIKKELEENKDNLILDGELYTDDINFEKIVGLVRKNNKSKEEEIDSLKIYFNIFDYIDENLSFEKRLIKLTEFFSKNNFKYLKFVKTEICNKKELIEKYLDNFINEGYEGIIIRNGNGKYEENIRSNNLLKLKRFIDEEFEIINYTTPSEGKEIGCVIWECKTKEGKKFTVRPEGNYKERKKLYKEGKKYIGKMLTVRYQELTNDKIPRFPVGVCIRDYE
jgi:DNA ligase-1